MQLNLDFTNPVKKCMKCGRIKSFIHFDVDKKEEDGLSKKCTDCINYSS
jgi:hypothetical protein